MNVAANAVSAVGHAKHPNDGDFSLHLARHASNCRSCLTRQPTSIPAFPIDKTIGLAVGYNKYIINSIFDNYLNNSQDQSAETPKYQMQGPEEGQEAAASEG